MLNKEEKDRVRAIFDDWLEMLEARQNINKDMNDLKKEASDILSVKTAIVTKLFSYLNKISSGGDDELEELRELIEEIQQ